MKIISSLLLTLIPSLASAATLEAQLDAKHSDRYLSATVTYDNKLQTIELSLQPKMPACGEGMMCAAVMPEPVVYTLVNASSETDDCGVVRTSAEFDQRPADGIFLKLQFNDNRQNTCPTFAPLAPVDAYVEQSYYNRIEGGEVSTLDTFEGQDIVVVKGDEVKPVPFVGQIFDVKAQGKTLLVSLGYGGGCREHEFGVELNSCENVRIGGRVYRQCEAQVLHTKGSDDMCRMYIRKTHKIELSNLTSPVIVKLAGKRVLVK